MTPIDYNNPNDMWLNNGYDPYKGLSDDELMKQGCLQLSGIIAAIIAALLICALFGSCTTTQYVPVVEHKTDTLIQTSVQRDSIWLHDSIHVTERGDTVRIERWHTKYVEREVHDTVYQSRVDSVPQPYPVIKEVEKPLSKTQRTLIYLGIAAMLGGIVAIAWRLKKLLPWA